MARKEFTVKEDSGEEIKLAIKTPEYEEVEKADRVRANKIASLIRESGNKRLLMRAHIEKFLKESGVWTEEDEKRIDELNKEIDALLNKLRKGGEKLSTGRELCIQAMDKRKEIVRIYSKRQVFDDATIESQADEERLDYFIYACTVYAKDGRNYWDSFEDMKNDKMSQIYRQAAPLVTEIVYGANTEFEKRLPENRWLKKYGFVDEELNYVDRKTGKKVDKSGNPIEEAEKKIQHEFENLQGEIKEEAPFIDDETNEEVIVEEKTDDSEKTEDESDSNNPEESEATTA